MRSALLAIPAVLAILSAAPLSASPITYRLHNHPDGAAGPPYYGLRLDELFNVTAEHDIFTFDFDDAGSEMLLTYEDCGTVDLGDDTVRIHGTTYGGLDTGAGFGNASYRGYWSIDFEYTANFTSGGTSITVTPDHPDNRGSITSLFGLNGGSPISLVDEDGGMGFSFKLNNTDDYRLAGSGLSGPDTFVGWGWLTHGSTHLDSSDWIFTASPVPEPATVVLMGGGILAGLAARRRRQDRKP